ncbi:MAG: RNA polymerase sigma factor [Candidatus Kapaibacterium sp.]
MSNSKEYDQFVELLRPVQKQLYHFARALTDDYDEACDLVGATLLGALENYNGTFAPATFKSYLFTIAVRIQRRKKNRRRFFIPLNDEHIATERCNLTPPDETVDIQALYKALNKLPEKQREAVALFELTGLSLKEIQKIQGGSLSGVKSRITRGRAGLAELLGVKAEGGKSIESTQSTSTLTSFQSAHVGN